jgi:hypothetical protein
MEIKQVSLGGKGNSLSKQQCSGKTVMAELSVLLFVYLL